MSEGEVGTAELEVTPPPGITTQEPAPIAEADRPDVPQKEPLKPPTEAKEPPAKETLAKTRRILEEMRDELEGLKEDAVRAQELGMTEEDIKGEAAKIQEAIDGLDKEKDPEKAKSYLLAVYKQRSILLGNIEKIVKDPEKAREALRKQGADEIADQLLPEGEAVVSGAEVVAKAEEAEEKARVKEGARSIRGVLKDLGVSEQELAKIDDLINQPAEKQINTLIEAQRRLGREDRAKYLESLQGDPEKALAELRGHQEKITKANLWQWAKYGGITAILLVMLLFQLAKEQ